MSLYRPYFFLYLNNSNHKHYPFTFTDTQTLLLSSPPPLGLMPSSCWELCSDLIHGPYCVPQPSRSLPRTLYLIGIHPTHSESKCLSWFPSSSEFSCEAGWLHQPGVFGKQELRSDLLVRNRELQRRAKVQASRAAIMAMAETVFKEGYSSPIHHHQAWEPGLAGQGGHASI